MEKSARRRIGLIRQITTLALFSAISTVLMYLEFGIPIFPPFLRFDFSDLPALLAAFLFGPLQGIAVALVKNAIHMLVSWSGGVGELANFIVSASLAGVAGWVYSFRRTRGGALLGMAFGTLAMAVAGALANYFITLPFYVNVIQMSMDDIVAMCAQLIPAIKTKLDVVLLGITPFNLFKGIVVSALTFVLYKRIGRLVR